MRLLVNSAGAVAALALAAGSASAADLYSNGGSTKDGIVSPFAAPTVSWTGFYIGGNIGWAEGASRDATSASLTDSGKLTGQEGVIVTTPDLAQASASGVFGGGQAGYQLQYNSLVFGVETDIQGGGIDGSSRTDISSLGWAYDGKSGSYTIPKGSSLTFTTKQSIDWFGTLRGRVGIAVNQILLYGTGGAAYGNVRDEVRGVYSDGTNTVPGGVSHDDVRFGYAAGGGLEYKVGSWSGAFEYLHTDFGKAAISAPLSVVLPGDTTATKLGTLHTSSIDSAVDTFRVKLNYHF